MRTTTAWLSSVLTGAASAVPVRFLEGDTVDVLRACRLPAVEEVIQTGRIARVDVRPDGEPLYWIAGLPVARTAGVLRLVQRGTVRNTGILGDHDEETRVCPHVPDEPGDAHQARD
jgi:hypothetical protein